MAPSVEKKIAELEMGLLHLQQNIDIPEITLTIHPTVAQAIKTCMQEGRKPRVGDFGDKVDDSNFLNALQGGVNRWIREIQKVDIKAENIDSLLSIGLILLIAIHYTIKDYKFIKFKYI